MSRIPLLPNEYIDDWWKNHKHDSKRQQKLRDAVETGLKVDQGLLCVVDAEKAQLLEAVDALKLQEAVNIALQVINGSLFIIEPDKMKQLNAFETLIASSKLLGNGGELKPMPSPEAEKLDTTTAAAESISAPPPADKRPNYDKLRAARNSQMNQ